MNKKTKTLIIVLAAAVVILAGLKLTQKKQPGGGGGISPTPSVGEVQPTEAPKYPTTIGSFLITNNEICLENKKPIIYYFGSSTCPHCQWESPVIKKVTDKFPGLISFHNNMDSEKDQDVFAKYADINPGYIPFLVFGCKYARVGGGENDGEKIEEENLTALICKLTGSKPASVCGTLKDKISEIK